MLDDDISSISQIRCKKDYLNMSDYMSEIMSSHVKSVCDGGDNS